MLQALLVLAVTCLLPRGALCRYQPIWDSLDTRPLPEWYDEAKFGIFLHWGVYSVPSFGNAGRFWEKWHDGDPAHARFMKRNYRPGFTYADFAPQFTAEFFNPDRWADLFKAAGAKYVVLTTKHHEGFTLWPSKYAWNWNAVDVGPNRDLVGDLAAAVRNRAKIHFGVYHSLFEFFNPFWLSDEESNFTQVTFPAAKTIPELYELVNRYQPDVIWSDGDREAPNSDYWGSKEFIAWLYNDSPVRDRVVTNDRWGKDSICRHGDFRTCHDHYNPRVLQKHKWENCLTVDRDSWGFRRDVSLADIRSMEELTAELVETVSCGGNMLLNIGPTHDGRIVPIFEERLRQMGEWLNINGEAIYATRPWVHQNDSRTPRVWYTRSGKNVYVLLLKWPADRELKLGSLRLRPGSGKLTLLGGTGKPLKWSQKHGKKLSIQLPHLEKVTSRWAWAIRAENALSVEEGETSTLKGKSTKSHEKIRQGGKEFERRPSGERLTRKIEAVFGKMTSRKNTAYWLNSVDSADVYSNKRLHGKDAYDLP